MTSAFTTQLSQIAAASTNELNLKAQKAAHSQSLIFGPGVAGSQDFETIYQICVDGFQDLCRLDQRFLDFQRNIFNPQSKDQDRVQMTAKENEALDNVLEQFLSLIGSRILLRPAGKALEWLIRRFQVHIYNTTYLISTFLPYHDTTIFQDLLSILPENLPVQYRFLGPYLKSAVRPPRHAIAYSATNSDPFFTAFSTYTLQTCRQNASYPLLLAFWTSVVIEAVAGRLALTQSGRREVQQQRQEDVLLQVLPLVSEGLSLPDVHEMILACYTVAVILAEKVELTDKVIDSLMEAIALSLSTRDLHSGLVCLSILAGRKTSKTTSKKLLKLLKSRSDLSESLRSVPQSCSVNDLVQALTRRALQGLKKENYVARMEFVAAVVANTELRPEYVSIILQDILHLISSMSGSDAVTSAIRARSVDLLRKLCRSEIFSQLIRHSASELQMGQADLDSLLGLKTANTFGGDLLVENANAMDVDVVSQSEDIVEDIFEHIPKRTVTEQSFLRPTDTPLFGLLLEAFLAGCKERNGVAKFRALSIWHTRPQDESLLYVTFLLRIASGPYPEACRAAALTSIAQKVEEQESSIDSQVLLAYIIPRLTDPAQVVRQAASEVLIAMQGKAPHNVLETDECQRWGAEDLYASKQMKGVHWLPASDLSTILKEGFLPTMEECVADSTHAIQVIQQVFLGIVSNPKAISKHSAQEIKELKKSQRHDLFECLLSHVVATPLLASKIEIINLLKGVSRVGSTNKTKILKAVVQQWALLSNVEATSAATREGLEVTYVDDGMMEIISSADKDAVSLLVELVIDVEQSPRISFLDSVFAHLASIWSQTSPSARAAGSQKLIDLSLSTSTMSERARETLSSVQLPVDALVRLLHTASTIDPDMKDTTPSRKRRHSSSETKPSATPLNSIVSQMTLALELVDASKPEQHPELLPELFEALNALQILKRQSHRGFPYLLNLCLSSILAIVTRLKPLPETKNVLADARIDLVTDCIRQTDSPQVQNSAILLSAELARVVPDKILHNVMPIFTFLGGHALGKDDEYSVYAVNQAIDQIIPPLVQTLKKKRKHVRKAICELLASFCAAFEHIAQHRRFGLYRRLISKLGTKDTLDILATMLMLRNTNSATVGGFVTSLMSNFEIGIQLQAFHDLLTQAEMVFRGMGEVAEMLTSNDLDNRELRMTILSTMLLAAERILKAIDFGVGLKDPDNELDPLETHVFCSMGILMGLGRSTADRKELNLAVEHCTEALLGKLPLAEFLDVNARMLETSDFEWQQDGLLLLEVRLSTAAVKDSRSRKSMLALIYPLTKLVSHNTLECIKLATIRCMGRITEICGRTDTSAVVEAATVLSTTEVISSEQPMLQTVNLLCLVSMLNCAKEAIIPIVPKVMSLSLAALETSLAEQAEDDKLHDAAYALISAIISNVSFMIPEDSVDKIMRLSAESANAGLGQHSHTSRQNALDLLACKVETKYIVSSLQRTWSVAIENDVDAASQALDVLSNTIKSATRASLVALADQNSALFTQMLELRRVQFTHRDEDSYTEAEVSTVEDKVNKVALEFIYKLNDTVFRPIFTQWVDWAVKCSDVPSTQLATAKLHRQTSLFRFLAHFFGRLKSIVTSYATHTLAPAVDVLQSSAAAASAISTSTPTLDTDQRILWTATLDMIAEACKHDQDSLFAAPAHFPLLAESLVAQLKLASDKTLQVNIQEHALPALVALAFATADNAEQHKQLNHHLCQLRHSEATGVRMAGIRAQHALIESDDVGQEWVEHVVQGGGEIMIYVNEMLEDDDEEVEREVRRWVRRVREMVGEDFFEA